MNVFQVLENGSHGSQKSDDEDEDEDEEDDEDEEHEHEDVAHVRSGLAKRDDDLVQPPPRLHQPQHAGNAQHAQDAQEGHVEPAAHIFQLRLSTLDPSTARAAPIYARACGILGHPCSPTR